MISKNKFALFIILMFSLILSGCTANRELDEQSLVTTLCFSYDNNFSVTVEVLTEDSKEQRLISKTHKANGKTPEKAIKNLDNTMPKRAMFDHCAAIVLSPEMSKEKQKLALEYCVKSPTINLGTPVIYCSEPETLLECKSENVAVGYDIIMMLKLLSLEKSSRLYKTALTLEGIETFKNKNGELKHIDKKT